MKMGVEETGTMMSDNSTENIFRFMQLRAPAPVDDGNSVPLLLNDRTPLAMQLAAAAQHDERSKIADTFLRNSNLSELVGSEVAQRILSAVKDLRDKAGNVEDLGNKVGSNKTEIGRIRDSASDVLLAAKIANWAPAQLPEVESLFKASSALLNPRPSIRIAKYDTRAITLPETLQCNIQTVIMNQTNRPRQEPQEPLPSDNREQDLSAERIYEAKMELMSRAQPDLLRLPSGVVNGDSEALLSLNEKGMNLLTTDAKTVLSRLGLQPNKDPIDVIVSRLEIEMSRAAKQSKPFTSTQRVPSDSPETRPYIKDVGVADLLVVKQHLRYYERVDIAHIENILAGEKKRRTHRALERSEETFTTEREITEERQTELETAERFEMNKEAARTIKRDQEFGFGLTLSGKYGPSVEFSSNLKAGSTSSTEESTKSATRYGKDVMERSLERVVERVRTEQVRRLIREQEETNLHQLHNTDTNGNHITGVYQFVEKVYESQVFNYGIRQMFDFMVPEPASYIWYLEKTETSLNLPPPPIDFHKLVPSADSITTLNYLELAAMLDVEGVEHYPPSFLNVSASGPKSPGGPESGSPASTIETQIPVPVGYKPFSAHIGVSAVTDNVFTFAAGFGKNKVIWKPKFPDEYTEMGGDPGHRMATAVIPMPLGTESLHPYESTSKITLSALAYETNNYDVAIEATFIRTYEGFRAWQIKTYDKFLAAYLNSLQKYEAKVAELKAEAEAKARNANTKFGAPPSQNVKIVKTELKKHCISIVTRQRYEQVSVVQDGEPPYFDFPKAAEKGAFIRFFEQAFEWDQMQYVFYPYFWARKEKWTPMFMRNETDTQFLEFLQAGSARVVVPVRPGFEHAITHYLECGVIWDGEGQPPDINDPLYVPIITEIQERTGASQGEIPVGESWKTHVPTPLVILRERDEKLPRWKRPDPSTWEWEEDEENGQRLEGQSDFQSRAVSKALE